MLKKSTKTKSHKMDRHLISMQIWEIRYIAEKFGIKTKTVRWATAKAGRSRNKTYSLIRTYLQEIKCKTHKG